MDPYVVQTGMIEDNGYGTDSDGSNSEGNGDPAAAKANATSRKAKAAYILERSTFARHVSDVS